MNDPQPPVFPIGPLGRFIRRLRDVLGGSRVVPEPDPTPVDRPSPDDMDRQRLRGQVGVIRKALGEEVAGAGREGPRRPEDDADVHYLYHPGRALVREDDVEDLVAYFERRGNDFEGQVQRLDERIDNRLPRLAVLGLPRRTDDGDRVLTTIDELEADLRDGIATPDHLIYVCPAGVRLCPATEPEEPGEDGAWPPPASDSAAGEGVRVSVVDTGLWMDALTNDLTPWMKDVVPASPTDKESIDQSAIHEYAGHGTFVSGVIECLAPRSRVEVEGALTHGGAVYESAICQQLHEALTDNDHPQLISISAGTYTRRSMALLSFEILAAAHGLDDGEDTLVIAAAGNDGVDEPFWPAAFPWVVGVGSVDPDGHRSKFSNFGEWVDVYARGRNIVNAFPEGVYTCKEPENIHSGVADVRTFRGLARWSGTSFSTPIVTGLIAADPNAPTNIQDARDAVLKSATLMNGLPVVGPLT